MCHLGRRLAPHAGIAPPRRAPHAARLSAVWLPLRGIWASVARTSAYGQPHSHVQASLSLTPPWPAPTAAAVERPSVQAPQQPTLSCLELTLYPAPLCLTERGYKRGSSLRFAHRRYLQSAPVSHRHAALLFHHHGPPWTAHLIAILFPCA
jgi:hypothetical protein